MKKKQKEFLDIKKIIDVRNYWLRNYLLDGLNNWMAIAKGQPGENNPWKYCGM